MSVIPKQEKVTRERLEVKLDARIIELLDRYCLYLESEREYVVAQALELVFRKDKGFSAWQASTPAKDTDSEASGRSPTAR